MGCRQRVQQAGEVTRGGNGQVLPWLCPGKGCTQPQKEDTPRLWMPRVGPSWDRGEQPLPTEGAPR